MKFRLLTYVFFSLFIIAVGCSNNPADSGNGPVSESDKLQSQKLSASADSVISVMIKTSSGQSSFPQQEGFLKTAKSLYSDAAAKDPGNSHANFGAAIFGFQAVMEDPDFIAIKLTLNNWNTGIIDQQDPRYILAQFFLFGKSSFQVTQGGSTFDYYLNPLSAFSALMSLAYGSLSSPDMITLLQNKIDTLIIPQIGNSIAYMDKVLADKNFEFILTPDMIQESQGIKLDLGEAYLFSAIMKLMRGSLEVLNSYQLSIPGVTNPFDYAHETTILPLIESQDLSHGQFLKLRNTQILPSAKADFLDANQKVKSGVNFIKAETGDQSMDLIKKQEVTDTDQSIDQSLSTQGNPVPFLRQAQGILGLADALTSMLNGPFTVELGTGVDPLTINLANFFNNGIPDLKSIVPYHTWANLNNFPLQFSGSGIFENSYTIGGASQKAVSFQVMSIYKEITNSNNPYNDYTGVFSSDGAFTVQGRISYSGANLIVEPLSAGAKLIEDGSFTLDNQKRLLMSESAYNQLSTYILTHPNLYFDSVANLQNINYSSTHPLGVRNIDGVFLFAGTVNYTIPSGQDMVYLSSGANSGSKVEIPVFPDPTFGGLFPNMTQQKLQDMWGTGPVLAKK